MKKRILTYFVYVTALTIVITSAIMAVLTYGVFENHVFENMRVHAKLLSTLLRERDVDAVMPLLDEELRITLIDQQGHVCYDSEADEASMDSHADRPEVLGANAKGSGKSVRLSRTLEKSTFYYAVHLEDGRVLRIGQQADSIVSLYLQALPLMLVVNMLMTAVCVWIASRLAARIIRPVEELAANPGETSGVVRYPELEPFITTIEQQHREILANAQLRVAFTANVSHELKTPLTSISGYAELIENGMAAGDTVTHFAQEIRKSADRLLTLINDIIRLSQMDSPKAEVSMEDVDLAQAAQSVAQQLTLSAHKMQVTLNLDVRAAVIRADKRMMEELLYNLCDNAIRYNVSGGYVHVQVHPIRDKVIVRVQDTGIGIPKEHLEHIFERFYRVDKSRSKATGGTGLGLAIVKHIAASHEAIIDVDSELGRGTTITVTFDRKG